MFAFANFIDTNAQIISTIAGNGSMAYGGDGGPATAASMWFPCGLAVDSSGNVFTTTQNNRIRKIDRTGIISTIAGNGIGGFSGDGGQATNAQINDPTDLRLDGMGNLYISDWGNRRVRKVNTSGIITTVAGNGIMADTGIGIPATNAAIYTEYIGVDYSGNIYIPGNGQLRKVGPSGIINRIAGTGVLGYGGDGGPATAALLGITDIDISRNGNIYIVDHTNHIARRIDTSGIISRFAGTATIAGFSGDGGPATSAFLNNPEEIMVDIAGNVYITDYRLRIRKVDQLGIISTIAGDTISGFWGDGGPATAAKFAYICHLAKYGNGNIYIADRNNNRIRMISSSPYFVYGRYQAHTYCHGTVSVDTLLAANDSNSGNTEIWSLLSAPHHGMASVAYTAVSTCSTVIPSGLTYTSTIGYTGMDTFSVKITDGIINDTTAIYLTVQPTPNAGAISGLDTVCIPASITLTNTAPGGTWSSANVARATVAAGIVTGIAVGPAVISYSVGNACGIVAATHTVTVKGCTAGLSIPTPEAITIYPNPGAGTFTITIPGTGMAQLTICNIQGVKIKEATLKSNEPQTLKLDVPPGVYFLIATTSAGCWNKEIVILH